jgi:hypothetical protein
MEQWHHSCLSYKKKYQEKIAQENEVLPEKVEEEAEKMQVAR